MRMEMVVVMPGEYAHIKDGSIVITDFKSGIFDTFTIGNDGLIRILGNRRLACTGQDRFCNLFTESCEVPLAA